MLLIESAPRLSLSQCFSLLRAIEDIQSVSASVHKQCEECLHSTLAAYHGQVTPASPQKLLKTMSSMTSASSFSLLGNSMSRSTSDMSSSKALVKPKIEQRGWDWRKGIRKDAKGQDVLRMLRLGLARKIANYWVEEDGLED